MGLRSVTVLGATGSIGTSTLDLIRHHKEQYDVKVLTGGRNAAKLIEQIKEFSPDYIAMADDDALREVKEACPNVKILSMDEAAQVDTDWTMAAIVGTAGLVPTMHAIKRGQTVAFASKECLVAAGQLMMQAVQEYGTTFLPVDSEHNAIYQVWEETNKNAIKKLILTASGGPFREWTYEQMAAATPQQAVAHPTWSMGAKISVDSASLMNKALEVIEAHYLFAMPAEQIDVIIHPQSLIHSMVEYADGSILSQMGPSDMRTPIAYCLGWPHRIETSGPLLDLAKLTSLTFQEPDTEKFRSLALVREVLEKGQAASIRFNAANEIANQAFLDGQIGFTKIYDAVEHALCESDNVVINTIEDVIAHDNETRHITQNYITQMEKKVCYA